MRGSLAGEGAVVDRGVARFEGGHHLGSVVHGADVLGQVQALGLHEGLATALVDGHHVVHAHLAVLDAAVQHLVVQAVFHTGKTLHGVALAGLDQVKIGLARKRFAFGLVPGHPLVEVALAQAVELERHAREARAAVVRGHALVHAGLVDHGVQLGLHAGHRVDHAGQIRHVERIHGVRGSQLEVDRAIDRSGQLVHRGNALLWVEEQPFPVHGHHFHHQRLDVGRQGLGRGNAVQWAIGVELVGADPGQGTQCDHDQQWHGPDHQLKTGGVVPFRIVMSLGVRLAVLPGEQEGQEDHGDDDDEHQQSCCDHQLSLLRCNIAGGVENDHFAAARQEGCQSGRAQPCWPAGFFGFRHLVRDVSVLLRVCPLSVNADY